MKKIFALSVFVVALTVNTVFADFISINNPSFEVHNPYTKAISIDNLNNNIYTEVYAPYTVPPGSREWVDSMVGWDYSIRVGTVKFESAYYPSGVPDGESVAFNNGGTIYQTLSATLSPNTTYELTAYVGYQYNADLPSSACPGYIVELRAGKRTLAIDNSSLYPAGLFLPSKLTYTTSSADPSLGLPLQIRLYSYGIQTNFDNVSLKAAEVASRLTRVAAPVSSVPEPSTFLLLGLGLMALRRI